MADPAQSSDQNLLPVQAYFAVDGTFQTFIGQGQPFYATINPSQSGLNITNSTINSTTIGATTPSTGVFTNIATTTGTISTTPAAAIDIANKFYVDTVAQGLGPKQSCKVATVSNITLSGLQTINGYTTLSGDRVLVKDQGTSSENGIYVASSGPWARSADMDVWSEVPGAYTVILFGGQADTGWVCVAADTGTINVTAMPWVQFSGSATYTAGTGLTLFANQFSITNTGVTAATYGSGSSVPVFAVNAQGQLTSVTDTSIAISNTQVSGLGTMSTQNASGVAITGGSIDGTAIGASTASTVRGTTITATTQFSGAGTGLTGTASGLSIGGNAATATTAVTATSATTAANLAGGSAGTVPYQTASGTTTMLAVGTNGQVLTLAAGVPSWVTPTNGTVTSVSGTGTVSGISLSGTVTSSGSLTLGGALDLSSPPAIGGTTPAAITGTIITANTKFVGPYFDAVNSAGGALRNASGTAQLQWGAGGGNNLTLDVSTNMNGANAQIDISPTGTGHVHMKPAGSGSIEIAPTYAGTLDNLVIGGVTPLAGTFTTLRLNTTLSINGSTGTSGQVLTSSGSGLPTWTTPTAYATVTDDTTTNATRYPLFASVTAGNLTTEYVSSTKLQFNPSTGIFTATSFTGAGTGLTGTASGLSIGGTALNVTGTVAVGNGGTGVTTLTGLAYGNGASAFTAATAAQVVSVIGSTAVTNATNATNTAITDDTTTNATVYPTWVTSTTGNLPQKTSSTKLSFNPSTGALSVSNKIIIAP